MTDYGHSNIIILKQKIELAIVQHKWLKFDYVSEKMEITSRVVEPLSINDFKLYGRDIDKRALRQFQFDGIQKLELIDKGEVHATSV